MKALVYTSPETLDYRDEPAPERGENPLIRVGHVGVCGSDMHAWAGHDERRPAPLILGHEVSGTVLEGPGAGRRVTVNPLVTCGECAACCSDRDNLWATRQIISMPPRQGGFAELLAIPPGNLVPIPDGVPTEKAVLAEPLSCGRRAVGMAQGCMDRPLAEAGCLVIGSGAIGLGAALLLNARNAAEIHIAKPTRRAASSWRARSTFVSTTRRRERARKPSAWSSTRPVSRRRAHTGVRRGAAGRGDPTYRPGLGGGRARHPPHDAPGDHIHRYLYLQCGGFARHRGGDLLRVPRRARLDRDSSAFGRFPRLRRHQGRSGPLRRNSSLRHEKAGRSRPRRCRRKGVPAYLPVVGR